MRLQLLAIVPRVLSAVIGAIALGVAGILVFARIVPPSVEGEPPAPVTANFLAESYSCARGETRTIFRGGIEDGYAADNVEPAIASPNPHLSIFGARDADFDETEQDRNFYFRFEIPNDVVGGQLILKMRQLVEQTNDYVNVGFVGNQHRLNPDFNRQYADYSIDGMHAHSAWSIQGDIHMIELRDVRKSDFDLIDSLAAQPNSFIELAIGDDTSVDFIALVTCSAPPRGDGMTFRIYPISIEPAVGSRPVTASCHPPDNSSCNPFIGDMACTTALPMACYRPGNDPWNPEGIAPLYRGNGRYWIGGEIRLTSPVRADAFSTIGEANAYCEAQFGEDWRVADFHLSGIGFQFISTSPDEYEGPVWLDIRDQPYATCWSRQ